MIDNLQIYGKVKDLLKHIMELKKMLLITIIKYHYF